MSLLTYEIEKRNTLLHFCLIFNETHVGTVQRSFPRVLLPDVSLWSQLPCPWGQTLICLFGGYFTIENNRSHVPCPWGQTLIYLFGRYFTIENNRLHVPWPRGIHWFVCLGCFTIEDNNSHILCQRSQILICLFGGYITIENNSSHVHSSMGQTLICFLGGIFYYRKR